MHNPELYDSGDIGDKECKKCKALFLKSETICFFCSNGTVKLPPLTPDPHLLQDLCDPDNRTPAAENFRKHIMQIDSLLSMGAIYRPPLATVDAQGNEKEDRPAIARRTPGPPKPVLLNGHFQHLMAEDLMPDDPEKIRNSALYVMEPEE